MTTQNLLVELFTEELPPKALKKLGESFSQNLLASLHAQGLSTSNSAITAFASPRRLAAHITGVLTQAEDRAVSQKLMPVTVGLNSEGQATPALLKKLNSLGLDASAVADLKREGTGKAEALFLNSIQKGILLAEGLQKALEDTLAKLPIPKVMTYQLADGWSDVKFVRPAHSLIALHGEDIVPISILGLTAGRTTQGHRFEANEPIVTLNNADTYAQQLFEQGAVIASFAERRAEIVRQLNAVAASIGNGVKPIEDDALLDEVTALVERPNVLLCQFEQEFLDVPQECLILTMKANQKYFPLLDAQGTLTHQFLVVSNIKPDDASAVIGGNERVVRPRLADAKFFFDQDRKKTLVSRVEGLNKVVYHNKLGTQGERTTRVQTIAEHIGLALGGETLKNEASTAARLAKADLLTDMVGEFPELQGIMGRYYALHDGYSETIADAVEDHYKPRFAGDELPRNQVGVVVALADKLETLVGLFGIGQLPSGDKDPFALRRHALGVIRMLTEKIALPLPTLFEAAIPVFGDLITDPSTGLADFIFDRLASNLRDQGYTAQEIDAVLSLRPTLLSEIPKRLTAVRAFASLPEAAALAAANKRITNILKKAETATNHVVDTVLLQESAEQHLYTALKNVQPLANGLLHNGEYAAALRELAALKNPVDAFFENVMVNAEDLALRANRLALLQTLHETMNQIADLSRLAS